MLGPPTLLTYNRDGTGTLVAWLEKLGLERFLRSYPLPTLIEWGWLKPVHRVAFPIRFFNEWKNYPFISWEPPADLMNHAALWSYSWTPDDPSEPLWFLDPVFRPNHELSKILQSYPTPEVGADPPLVIEHTNGREVSPYLDYFYPWQGFALIDVIRASSSFELIYRTPDMIERANHIVQAAEYLSRHGSL